MLIENSIQFRGRRRGRRLRPNLKNILQEQLSNWEIKPCATTKQIDPQSLFDDHIKEVWMEIGFGAGEHLAWQAKHNPDVGFIGCEPYINGVARLLKVASTNKLSNIRVLVNDARPFLQLLPNDSLNRLFILFPDPWPKKRHNNRRVIQTTTFSQFRRILRNGGQLRIATDDNAYLSWILICASKFPEFFWNAKQCSDWRRRPEDWPQTRYETKALNAGNLPAFLTFVNIK